ncbi:ABC transporter ATP-binding protein [Varibaculum vaginae]|uniref:ABC transporter ATP-binding protein n=1 Tax=Varibaculum vaginae TaxID=2364797 RepID=UPI000F077BF3|nr:ATP-binding cassette domain-containing protein [Varibaculum vaginae]
MLIRTQGLSKIYGSHTVLADIDLTIGEGEQVAITGPTQAGKTTLLYLLSGILRPSSGSVILDGRDLSKMSRRQIQALRRERFGFIFQSEQLLPELQVQENVALPLLLQGFGRTEAKQRARQELERLGLENIAYHLTAHVSTAQAARIAIARALAPRPQVIVADQPTSLLDPVAGQEAMQALSLAATRTRATLLVSTVNPQVASWCQRIITLRDGLIAQDSVRESSSETRFQVEDA